jgi:hypothetical protein
LGWCQVKPDHRKKAKITCDAENPGQFSPRHMTISFVAQSIAGTDFFALTGAGVFYLSGAASAAFVAAFLLPS